MNGDKSAQGDWANSIWPVARHDPNCLLIVCNVGMGTLVLSVITLGIGLIRNQGPA